MFLCLKKNNKNSILVKEIHHRIKNNLQTIASLLRLQMRTISSPAAQEALTAAANRIISVAAVFDLTSLSGDKVELSNLISKLLSLNIQNLLLPGQTVKHNIKGKNIFLNSYQASILALILNEIIVNIFKHGFKGGISGAIKVKVNKNKKKLKIMIEDNGYGLPKEFSLISSANLGLKIVKTLVEKDLKGKINFFNITTGCKVVIEVEPE